MAILVFVRFQGDFGPFRPNIASEVPLWLAVALKKRGKCDIRAPDWMSVVMIIQVRSLIEDIRDVRFHKVETGLQTISGRTHAVKVYIQ
ncbi:hypothetical protein BHM03_00021490 [Ensete ventricosum]|nr:hypothetical protein BHM03_00021490 [Ensete ventricosum]